MSSHNPAPLRSLTPLRRNNPGMDSNVASGGRSQSSYVHQRVAPPPVMSPRPSGPVAILWDIENCPVPGEVNAEDVAGNIRIALREHPHIGAVTMFSAYGDFNHFPKKVREGCQRTGVNLIDVPNGKKDAADKAILVDMFLFALDNPPPSTIFLVTGDVDFAPALHKLGQRGYVVVLVIPDGVGVSSALRGAGRYVWDWPSLCRGQGLVEVPARAAAQRRSPIVHYNSEEPRYAGELFSELRTHDLHDDDDDHVYGEEILVQRKPAAVSYNGGLPFPQQHATVDYGHQTYGLPGHGVHPRVNTMSRNGASGAQARIQSGSPGGFANRQLFPTPDVAPTNSGIPQSADKAFDMDEPPQPSPQPQPSQPTSPGGCPTMWVPPGDFPGLKKQLVMLLMQNHGCMNLVKVPAEYNKTFGRPLVLAEYSASKLVHLLEKMKDTLVVKGEGSLRTLHLLKSRIKHNKPSGHKVAAAAAAATGLLPKADRDRDASDDSDPEVEVKEVPATPVVSSVRHLLDMDMDDVKPNAAFSHPIDWDMVNDTVKGKLEAAAAATKAETVVDVGEVCKAEDYKVNLKLAGFKQQLQELLVSYSLRIDGLQFPMLYQQRYGSYPDLQHLGVDSLDALFQKVKDVAVLKEKFVKGDKGESRKEYDVVAVC